MKYILGLLLVLGFLAFLFPRLTRKLLRLAGISVGDLGRMGKELATGEEIKNSPLARYEVRAGEIVALKMLAKTPLAPNRGDQERVGSVGSRLAEHALRKEIPYRFAVVEAEEPNAFAVPGGSIFITTALLRLCERDDNLLAAVLAHEIIHVDRRHAIRNLAASTAVRTGFQFLSLGRAVLLSRLSRGIEELLVQGYRQDQELEADAFGARVAALAGYDSRALLLLLERLQALRPEAEGTLADLLGYLKTHPPIAERRENLRREVARLEAQGARGEAPGG